MQVSEAVRLRRSYKWYDKDHQMPEETFRLLKNVIVCKRPLKIRRVAPSRSFTKPNGKRKGKRPGRVAV